MVQVDTVTLLDGGNIGLACTKNRSGHFATRPSREERLRRGPVSMLHLGDHQVRKSWLGSCWALLFEAASILA